MLILPPRPKFAKMGHLTKEQRYTIQVLKETGKKQKEIAGIIGKDKSVISRELSRNKDKRSGKYDHDLAQRKYEKRLIDKPKHISFTDEVRLYVDLGLEQKFSPEQIVGIAEKEGKACVSHERIYQYIWKNKKEGGDLYKKLRTKGKRYRKRGNKKDRRGQIQGRVDISQRPEEVEKRQRVGDLEIDTIIGKDHKGAIVTINDRASGMVKLAKVESKDADIVANKTIEALNDWKPYLKTITSDNGKEFAFHQKISQELKVDFYFAKPYHSWQRGSNENLNGLIRQYIPKKTNFEDITDEDLRFIETQLNNRPRKRFNFETPLTIFNKIVEIDKVAFVT